MDDMSGLLAHNFGIRPQGKSAPMAATKTSSANRSVPSSAWSHSPSASYDDIFNNPTAAGTAPSPSSPPLSNTNRDPILDTFNKGPVFDTPVYDEDDIFNGIPGIKSSSNFKYDDVFASGTSDRNRAASPPPYDDLLGNLGKSDNGPAVQTSPPAYDDFLGGLGMGQRKDAQDRGSAQPKGQGLSGFDDLIPGFGSSSPPPSQPKREIPRESELPKAAKAATQNDPFFDVGSGGSFSDPLENLTTKPEATVKADASSPTNNDSFFSENPNSFDSMPSFTATSESNQNTNTRSPLDDFENMTTHHGAQSGPGGPSETPHRSVGSDGSDPFAENSYNNNNNNNMYTAADGSSEQSDTGDDVWLTVSEIPLFTKPTSAPPPSRQPPPLSSDRYNYGSQREVDSDERYGFEDGEMERSSAAMKDAMNKAEMKFKHAKEVREKMAKSKEAEQQDEEREKAELEREEREKERRRIERERMEERKRAEKEREGARRAVERATREARERAANEAMVKAQRATVMKAQQEARERAVNDARERAAQEAREKAEREAKERADREREVKERAERADRERRMQRAAVEKAAAEARERLAQAAKEKHQQNQSRRQAAAEPTPPRVPPPPSSQTQFQAQDDFDSIFGMGGSRSSSVPKKPTPDPGSQNRTPSAPAANIRKTASTTNMMDDLSAIFGGAPSSSGGEFQEIDGETEERRNARFTREMRTRDRAAKALAEKNARDMQAQHEQDERHRISETLDFEIKRWAAGKEGNLRSLLSSMHYILWPECGWQPVSMADLITGASVKKVYRKATLCIHPDKVQQKGATLQQKYIAEKVFDILKEAWNKFNSEELF